MKRCARNRTRPVGATAAPPAAAAWRCGGATQPVGALAASFLMSDGGEPGAMEPTNHVSRPAPPLGRAPLELLGENFFSRDRHYEWKASAGFVEPGVTGRRRFQCAYGWQCLGHGCCKANWTER